MATIIFDFDHTLFDTRHIRKDIKDLFLKNGVPEEIFEFSNKKHREEYNDTYDLIKHISDLEKEGYKIDKQNIDIFFEQNLEMHLKGPVKEVLSSLIKDGHKLILLSKGNETFQRFKVKQSGIEAFFGEHIYICYEKKEELIEKIPREGKTYFVNDHADEIEAVAKKHPEINFIYVKGPKTSHDRFIEHEHIPTIDDISALPELIG